MPNQNRPHVNDNLQNDYISYAVDLRSFEEGEVQKVRGILHDLEKTIVHRLNEVDENRIEHKRLKSLLRGVRESLSKAVEKSREKVDESIRVLSPLEQEAGRKIVFDNVGVDLMSRPLHPDWTKNFINGPNFNDTHLDTWFKNIEATTQMKLESGIRRGVLTGQSTQEIVRNIRGRLTGKDIAILTEDGNEETIPQTKGGTLSSLRHSITTAVRTAIQSVSQKARMDLANGNADIVRGVQAIATLDGRTSDICIARSNALWDLEGNPLDDSIGIEFPGPPPWHPNCRTQLIPVLKDYETVVAATGEITKKKLGKIPPSTQASMDGQVSSSLSYEDWLKTKPEDFQKKVLGISKWRMWKEGKITLQNLSSNGRILTVDELQKSYGSAQTANATGSDGGKSMSDLESDHYKYLSRAAKGGAALGLAGSTTAYKYYQNAAYYENKESFIGQLFRRYSQITQASDSGAEATLKEHVDRGVLSSIASYVILEKLAESSDFFHRILALQKLGRSYVSVTSFLDDMSKNKVVFDQIARAATLTERRGDIADEAEKHFVEALKSDNEVLSSIVSPAKAVELIDDAIKTGKSPLVLEKLFDELFENSLTATVSKVLVRKLEESDVFNRFSDEPSEKDYPTYVVATQDRAFRSPRDELKAFEEAYKLITSARASPLRIHNRLSSIAVDSPRVAFQNLLEELDVDKNSPEATQYLNALGVVDSVINNSHLIRPSSFYVTVSEELGEGLALAQLQTGRLTVLPAFTKVHGDIKAVVRRKSTKTPLIQIDIDGERDFKIAPLRKGFVLPETLLVYVDSVPRSIEGTEVEVHRFRVRATIPRKATPFALLDPYVSNKHFGSSVDLPDIVTSVTSADDDLSQFVDRVVNEHPEKLFQDMTRLLSYYETLKKSKKRELFLSDIRKVVRDREAIAGPFTKALILKQLLSQSKAKKPLSLYLPFRTFGSRIESEDKLRDFVFNFTTAGHLDEDNAANYFEFGKTLIKGENKLPQVFEYHHKIPLSDVDRLPVFTPAARRGSSSKAVVLDGTSHLTLKTPFLPRKTLPRNIIAAMKDEGVITAKEFDKLITYNLAGIVEFMRSRGYYTFSYNSVERGETHKRFAALAPEAVHSKDIIKGLSFRSRQKRYQYYYELRIREGDPVVLFKPGKNEPSYGWIGPSSGDIVGRVEKEVDGVVYVKYIVDVKAFTQQQNMLETILKPFSDIEHIPLAAAGDKFLATHHLDIKDPANKSVEVVGTTDIGEIVKRGFLSAMGTTVSGFDPEDIVGVIRDTNTNKPLKLFHHVSDPNLINVVSTSPKQLLRQSKSEIQDRDDSIASVYLASLKTIHLEVKPVWNFDFIATLGSNHITGNPVGKQLVDALVAGGAPMEMFNKRTPGFYEFWTEGSPDRIDPMLKISKLLTIAGVDAISYRDGRVLNYYVENLNNIINAQTGSSWILGHSHLRTKTYDEVYTNSTFINSLPDSTRASRKDTQAKALEYMQDAFDKISVPSEYQLVVFSNDEQTATLLARENNYNFTVLDSVPNKNESARAVIKIPKGTKLAVVDSPDNSDVKRVIIPPGNFIKEERSGNDIVVRFTPFGNILEVCNK